MTRRQQFVERQRKWTRRRRRYRLHNHWPKSIDQASNSHGGGKPWAWIDGPLQEPLKLKGPRNVAWVAPALPPGWALTLTLGGRWHAPHVRLGGFVMDAFRARDFHFTGPIVGYHVRRVMRCGRKLGRMNGEQRRVMGATWHALTQGFYPDWDPQQRRPQAIDIDNGAPYVNIDWRWGVTGQYP